MELHRVQQEEQMEMMDLIFECVSRLKIGGDDSASASTSTSASAANDNMHRGGNARVGKVLEEEEEEEDEEHTTREVPTFAAMSNLPSPSQQQPPPPPQQQMQMQMQQYPPPPPMGDTHHNKQEEIKAVMRDRTMGRDERQQKLAEIKQRYAAAPAANSLALQQQQQQQALEDQHANKSMMDELRREEIQTVMKDKSLGREEKQKKLADIKSRYNALSSSTPAVQELVNEEELHAKNINRWNKAGVSAVTMATMNQRMTVSKGHQQQQMQLAAAAPSPAPPPASNSRANLWNKAAVVSVSSRAMANVSARAPAHDASSTADATSIDVLEINNDPMSYLINALQRNDPNLTMLRLDGRKFISDSEWEELFESLEGNVHLTHLSMINCGLTDGPFVPLVLALVENETLVYLNLSYNRGLTEDTWKGLVKVLKQSNQDLKTIVLDGTTVSFFFCLNDSFLGFLLQDD